MEDRCKPNILHIYDGEVVKPFEAGKPGWADIPQGAVITEPGNARKYNTGYWRSERAVYVPERCIQCLRCWVSCPDVAWMVKDGKVTGVDYKYCKGCGICDRQCPVDAIYMMDEEEAIEEINTKGHATAYNDTPEFWPKMDKKKKTD